MKNPWTVIGVITVVLFGGAMWFSSVSAEKNNEGVEISPNIKGNLEASVKLVEFSDFQCPACSTFQPALQEVMTLYGDNLSLEYKHFPLPIHPFAKQAAVAAEAAGQQGKFFEFHDLLFANQSDWAGVVTPGTYFIQYAEELGLDIGLFRSHLNASLLRDKVQAEAIEAQELGVTGTPTFFLNGEKMTFESYQSFIDQVAFAVDPESASTTDVAKEATNSAVRFGL